MRVLKAYIVVICLFVTGIIISTQRSIATSYELSIYSATPMITWLLIGALLISGIIGAIISANHTIRIVSIIALLSGIVLFVSIPLLRGYFFHGNADPLTHLGWARQISDGSIEPTGLLYPYLHILTAVLSSVSGLSERTILLSIMAFPVVLWLLFSGILVRELIPQEGSFAVGVASAALLLPLQPVSGWIRPHTTTVTMFLLPFGIWCYLQMSISRNAYKIITPLVTGAILLYHPQQALNLLIIVLSIGLVSWITSNRYQTSLQLHTTQFTLALGIAFSMWVFSSDQFTNAFRGLMARLILGVGADQTQVRGASLEEVGRSLTEIGLRIGGRYLLFGGLVLIGVVYAYQRRDILTIGVALSMVPLTLMIAVFAIAGRVNQYTRYMGFVALVATLIGAVGAIYLLSEISLSRERLVRVSLAALFCTILLLSLPVAYPSPYIQQAGGHVTESQYAGYTSAFEYSDRSYPFIQVRTPVERVVDAEYGQADREPIQYDRSIEGTPTVPDNFNDQELHTAYDGNRYLLVADSDYAREISLHKELRWTEDDFEYLNRSPHIDRVRDSGGAELYIVRAENPDPSDEGRG
ncbi:hypothetical protein [Halalkalicoccus ordinarius]|uniref:hypothetical protein n=1 Tax=Halalkalicoccus ordinarius TaxID=3116651 RepID=UPI00300E9605